MTKTVGVNVSRLTNFSFLSQSWRGTNETVDGGWRAWSSVARIHEITEGCIKVRDWNTRVRFEVSLVPLVALFVYSNPIMTDIMYRSVYIRTCACMYV